LNCISGERAISRFTFSWIFEQVTLSKAARRLSPSPYNDVVSNVFHFFVWRFLFFFNAYAKKEIKTGKIYTGCRMQDAEFAERAMFKFE